MARNDVVILDSLVEKARSRLGKATDDSELFELFTFDQVMKDYDLSYEELETGWTDGGDDGGLDGFYVLIDGRIATDDVIEYAARRHPKIDVIIFSVRRTDSFQLQPIDAVFSSLSELLDLTKNEQDLMYPIMRMSESNASCSETFWSGLLIGNRSWRFHSTTVHAGQRTTFPTTFSNEERPQKSSLKVYLAILR